jgi:hypothetical protein
MYYNGDNFENKIINQRNPFESKKKNYNVDEEEEK